MRMYTRVFRDKKKLAEMLQHRANGWTIVELSDLYNVDHTSILYQLKNNQLPKRSRVWSVIDKTRLIMEKRFERGTELYSILKGRRIHREQQQHLKKNVLKSKYECIVHRTVNRGKTYKDYKAVEKERTKSHIDRVVGI